MRYLLLILICFPVFGISQTFIQSNESVFITPIVSSSSVGDYDGDGDLDIIVMGLENSTYQTKVYDNDGAGNFSLSTINLLHQYRNGQVEFVDYDNDNDLDIFISGIIENETFRSRLYNNSNGSFTEISYPFGGNITNNQFTWSDFDNDGDLDLILMGDVDTFYKLTFLYRNDGEDQFTSMTNSIGGYSQGAVLSADLDNDGDNDIVVTGLGTDTVDELTIYKNNGGFNFVLESTLEGYFNGELKLNDVNGDGFVDVFKTGNMADNGSMVNTTTKLYLNFGDFIFTEYTNMVFPSLYNYSKLAIADFNGNGEKDFFLTGRRLPNQTQIMASIFVNQGNLNFIENNTTGITPSFHYDIEIGDFDNDQDVDVFVTNNNFSNIFINQITTQNTKPLPPTTLTTSFSDNGVTLNWNYGSDSESPLEQLSYNIYVGSVSNTTNVISPMSDIANGYRKVVNIGNMQYKNTVTLNNLPLGTYYWAVQAIDNQYKGSTFSTEQTFTIGNLDIEEFRSELLVQYTPNPVSNQLTISSNNGIEKVVINTLLGEKLKTIMISKLTDFKIDFANYDSGVYFISLHSNEGKEVIKVIKK